MCAVLHHALFTGSLMLLLLATAGCNRPAATPAWADQLDAFIQYEMADKDIPTLSIVLVDDQQQVWSRGYGRAAPAAGTAATGQTVYRVASVSKLFTAVAAMQLVEQGLVDLDAPLTTYLPDFAPENPYDLAITLRQLLSHRSGLVREPPVGHYFDPDEPSVEATVASLNQTRLIVPPASQTKYSNAAVTVAGHLVATVAGQPFPAYAQQHLFAPMAMANSSFAPTPQLREQLATGYMWTYDGRTFEAPVFELGLLPAANLYTTMEDLGRFMQMLFARGSTPDGQVLQPETLETMWTVQFAPPTQQSGFGLGFFVSDFMGHRRVQHSGVMYGYATRLFALPDARLGVAVVDNMDATNNLVDRIGNYALALMLAEREGRPLPAFDTTAAIDPARARALDGRYEGPRTLELVERNGLLYLFNGTEYHRLKQRGDTLVVDDRLAHGYTLLPTADRLTDAAGDVFLRTVRPRPGPVDPEVAGLIGSYGWDHNTLYILEREGQLWALIEWFFYYPLTRVDGDLYAFPADYGLYMGETIAFTRNAEGHGTQADLGGVVFERRAVASEEGNTFQITPIRPPATLRREALAATPPEEDGPFRASDLVEITTLDPSIRLDVRYATTNNFMGEVFYDEARAFLQRPAAEALVEAHQRLRADGLGLVIYDAYRPWYVTKMFWEATPDDLKDFVANPENGSRHNRGCAVDLGLIDLATGAVVAMPSGYDEFTHRAYADYPGGTARARWYRERLRDAMEAAGFTVYPYEWWHYDYKDWQAYPIQNLPFEAIAAP